MTFDALLVFLAVAVVSVQRRKVHDVMKIVTGLGAPSEVLQHNMP